MNYANKLSEIMDDDSKCDGEIITTALELLDDADNQIKSLLVEAIANYMVVTGARCTTEGNYIFEVSELAEKFEIPANWIVEHEEDIVQAVFDSGFVIDASDGVWVYDEGNDRVFDLNFYTSYCGLEGDDE